MFCLHFCKSVQEKFLTIFARSSLCHVSGCIFLEVFLPLCSELCSKNGQSLGIFQRNVSLFSLFSWGGSGQCSLKRAAEAMVCWEERS